MIPLPNETRVRGEARLEASGLEVLGCAGCFKFISKVQFGKSHSHLSGAEHAPYLAQHLKHSCRCEAARLFRSRSHNLCIV